MRKRTLLTWAPLGVAAGLIAMACGSDDAGTTGTTCNPSAEVCDGADNDCDGQVDEDLVQDCTTEGQAGKQTCGNGTWGPCEVTCTPVAETCDGKDNDCDSAVDEDEEGNALTQTCTTSDGQDGFQYCNAGAWSPCTADCTPSPEICDGADNDCDGTVDEDDSGGALKQDCSNECGLGSEVCANGQWTSCTAPQPSDEVCDGVDNDCDQEIDEDFECAKGEQANCGTDVGACEFGTKVCGDSCVWGNCIGGVNPGTEDCDGGDEDCDGTEDNGCSCVNGEVKECCGGTTITCTGGAWPSCPAPPTEICNGVDDDCDGDTDEGLPVNPYMLDEDISGIDDCAHADTITTPIVENAGALGFSYHLYKDDLSEDTDYFLFRADEDNDFFGCIDSGPYECYTVVVKMTKVPTGADYDFCLYDVGFENSTATCADPEQKLCASDEAPFDQITVNWAGDCAFDDNRYFFLEVFPVSGSALSCEPYTFSIEHLDNVPQEDACSF